jgi:hypothetical protein
MELLEKLQKEFPNNDIKLEQIINESPLNYEHWKVIVDGKRLKVRFRDWGKLFEKLYNLDIKDEIFRQVVSEIKRELKKTKK